MGIVNVTPDSFSDQGCHAVSEKAIEYAIKLIEDGADLLDIGGESSRPGSTCVNLEEELRRVIPVIEALKSSTIPISVDTTKPEVMQASIQAGASMINDINALRSEGALKIIAESGVMVCLMHMKGMPKTMQDNPLYADVVSEVKCFLQQQIRVAQDSGITDDQLVIDPGFGFGKTLQHNLALFRSLDQFTTFNVPVMVGISRKSMLGTITGNGVNHRTYASITAAVLAAAKGVKILRVHDVKATKEAILVFNALNQDIK
ncbi:MAG: dihydropteroate synthase [Nitrosomonas sp.]|nr:dihydropteroate synthase [Nitrosomonas sp.]MBK7364588.1 dihydropteroate synthase [Nitrosomonas sp.]